MKRVGAAHWLCSRRSFPFLLPRIHVAERSGSALALSSTFFRRLHDACFPGRIIVTSSRHPRSPMEWWRCLAISCWANQLAHALDRSPDDLRWAYLSSATRRRARRSLARVDARSYFYVLIVFAGTGGELCVSRAMKTIGEVTDFRPHALVRVIFRAMRVSGCGSASR